MFQHDKKELLTRLAQGIPCKVHYRDLGHIIPQRSDFLNAEMQSNIVKILRKSAPVLFMPNDILEREINGKYIINVFGILLDGSKTCVQLTNVPIFFDIQTENGDVNAVLDVVKIHTKYTKHEVVENYPFDHFTPTAIKYVRIYFDNLIDRTAAIYYMNSETSYKLAYDDDTKKFLSGEYFNKLSRETRFRTADWNRIEKYTPVKIDNKFVGDHKFSYSTCTNVLIVDSQHFVKLKKDRRKMLSETPLLKDHLEQDRTIIASWDIETYNLLGYEGIPNLEDPKTWILFCISLTLSWTFSPNPFLGVVISLFDADYAENAPPLTVICETELEVCMAFSAFANEFKPEIWTAFNGSRFDWPAYLSKMKHYNNIVYVKKSFGNVYMSQNENENTILRFNIRKKDIKISAELTMTMDTNVNFGGFIDTDAQIIMRQLYPKAEVLSGGSLNYYLKLNELDPKADLPYIMMFKIFELCSKKGDPEEIHKYIDARVDYAKIAKDLTDKQLMGLVNYYCYVDSLSVHRLLYKTSTISDRRENANLSHVQLYNAFYHANSQKVFNLVGGYAHKHGIAFSNRRGKLPEDDKMTIGGGLVLAPKLGLDTESPVVGFDFASLYPSLIISFNLSNDKLVLTEERANELRAEGYTLHEINMVCLKKSEPINVRGWVIRHNEVRTKGDKPILNYRKTITYSYAGEKVSYYVDLHADEIGIDAVATSCIYNVRQPPPQEVREKIAQWPKYDRTIRYDVIRHERDPLPRENLGLLGIIMLKMLGKRKPLKNEFLALKAQAEAFILSGQHERAAGLEFLKNKLDAKQKAIKIQSNSFYGCLTNHNSPIFNVIVGGGITKAGRDLLKRVYDFVCAGSYTIGLKKPLIGPKPFYGDTDSVYTPVSPHLLEVPKTDNLEDCWAKKVKITLDESKLMNEEINDYLITTTNCSQMSMSYEEVGFPSVFCGKKKYFFYQHFKSINFNPPFKDVFIRGLDSIKGGKNRIIREIGERFITRALSPTNKQSLIDIAEDILREFYENDWDVSDFSQIKTYKPTRKNISVLNFYSRMEKIYKKYEAENNTVMMSAYRLPEPGEKFQFVKVVKPQTFNNKGNKMKLSAADYMEFVSVYEYYKTTNAPMIIDKGKYVDEIITTLSRFITYHPDFKPNFEPTSDNYTDYDKHIMTAARNYLEDKCPAQDETAKNIQAELRTKLKPVIAYFKNNGLKNVAEIFFQNTPMTKVINQLRMEHYEYDTSAAKSLLQKLMCREKLDIATANDILALPRGTFAKMRIEMLRTLIEKECGEIISLGEKIEPHFGNIDLATAEKITEDLIALSKKLDRVKTMQRILAKWGKIANCINELKFSMIANAK